MKFSKIFTILAVMVVVAGTAAFMMKKGKTEKETLVLIETSVGNLKVKLYNETPLHRDNFLKLVNENYYDSLLFHRVIKNFMIQAGDPLSKNAKPKQQLGMGDPGYTVPAEINSRFIHKKGALAAARTGDQMNPERRSSGSQFYIVHGDSIQDGLLEQAENMFIQQEKNKVMRGYLDQDENSGMRDEFIKCQRERNQACIEGLVQKIEQAKAEELSSLDTLRYTAEQKNAYKTAGGAPHLDRQYTVFGELVEGFDVLDSIASVSVDRRSNRPDADIRIISTKVVKK